MLLLLRRNRILHREIFIFFAEWKFYICLYQRNSSKMKNSSPWLLLNGVSKSNSTKWILKFLTTYWPLNKNTMKPSDILKKENILRALKESTEDQRKELNKTFTQALKESSEKMYRTYVDTPWKKAMFWWIVRNSKNLPK